MDYLKDIVPANALGITVFRHWRNGVELRAPLRLNLNDKGSGFAGSISSMLILAGWTLITHELQEAGITADVMVVKSQTEFSAAVRTDLSSVCETSSDELARVFQELEARGRSRIELRIEIPGCARMVASFAVLLKN